MDVRHLSARQAVGASLVEAYAEHRSIVSPESEGLVDRQGFLHLSPGRGKHVTDVVTSSERYYWTCLPAQDEVYIDTAFQQHPHEVQRLYRMQRALAHRQLSTTQKRPWSSATALPQDCYTIYIYCHCSRGSHQHGANAGWSRRWADGSFRGQGSYIGVALNLGGMAHDHLATPLPDISREDACSFFYIEGWVTAQPAAAHCPEWPPACVPCISSLAPLASHQCLCIGCFGGTDHCKVERDSWSAASSRRRRPSLPQCRHPLQCCLYDSCARTVL